MKDNIKKIYLAAGCFWGSEAYFKKIDGILSSISGYANGKTSETRYEIIPETDHAETVELIYDNNIINLTTILEYYFRIIDPTSINKQGNDRGRQYRTGIYYCEEMQERIAKAFINEKQNLYNKLIVVEVEKLKNFIKAEDYHQNYLEKNPFGYCHINLDLANEKIKRDEIINIDDKSNNKYKKKSKEELKEILTPIQYEVTQNKGTEKPFINEYDNNFEKGIYVDITTGEPLFLSNDKFNSGCGWPAFSKPISNDIIEFVEDKSFGMIRTEVRSKKGDSHLGHVFNDGPSELGGIRYCINSASLRFISYENMKNEGYEEYMKFIN